MRKTTTKLYGLVHLEPRHNWCRRGRIKLFGPGEWYDKNNGMWDVSVVAFHPPINCSYCFLGFLSFSSLRPAVSFTFQSTPIYCSCSVHPHAIAFSSILRVPLFQGKCRPSFWERVPDSKSCLCRPLLSKFSLPHPFLPSHYWCLLLVCVQS